MDEESLSEGDKFFLYEEFFLLIPRVRFADARTRAAKLYRDFDTLRVRFGKQELLSTISIGVSIWLDHGNSMNKIVRAVDSTLYQAIQVGRNCVCVMTSARTIKNLIFQEA